MPSCLYMLSAECCKEITCVAESSSLQEQLLGDAQVKDLKEMCKERKIRGYSSMRKSQLVRTLKPILAEEM